MPEPLRLTVTLAARGPAAAIVLTDEQVQTLSGGAKTPAVKVTVDGGATYDLRVGRMGGENLIGFSKAVRSAAQVEAGDTIDVMIELDDAPRRVEVPDDLAAAMAAAGVRERFDALAPSHQKEYVRWVTEAKRTETRIRRIDDAVKRIAEGKPRTSS